MTAHIDIGKDQTIEYKPVLCNFDKDVEIVEILSTSCCDEL